MRSASSGASDANSRASTTSIGLGTRRLPVGPRGLAFDDDLPEQLRLLRLDAALAYQLQHREQRHHDLRALALAARERAEQERPRVAQHREDLGHALEHRGRVGLHLTRPGPALLLDEAVHRAREPVHAEILERQVVDARQHGPGPAPDERHLRLARAQPRALRLHARVLAQPVLQLLPEQQGLVVELLLGLVGRHEQLGLEIDEGGGHHEIRAGGLEVAELDGLEVREVLIGDGAHGQRGEVDLVGAAEVQEQVERAFEGSDAKPELGVDHGVRCTAVLTSSIVRPATARARRLPSCRICTMRSGFSTNCCRRSRIFSSGGIMCLRRMSLQSKHPKPAVRQLVATSSRSPAGVKILCRSKTGQISGLPGSERRLRAGSVIIGRTLARIVSGESASSMSLPYDFDILRPSVPGTLGISVSFTSGSGNTSPNALLKRRATSRVSSTCGAWSMPTGTHFGLYMRMSADWSNG